MGKLIYKEEQGDLFELLGKGYSFVQCISADFVMSAGIAVLFNKYLNIKEKLTSEFGDLLTQWDSDTACFETHGYCLYTNDVFNLVTKRNGSDFPTTDALRHALEELKWHCKIVHAQKLAMPKIACGIDGMDWDVVSRMIRDIFADEDIEILVRYIEN